MMGGDWNSARHFNIFLFQVHFITYSSLESYLRWRLGSDTEYKVKVKQIKNHPQEVTPLEALFLNKSNFVSSALERLIFFSGTLEISNLFVFRGHVESKICIIKH